MARVMKAPLKTVLRAALLVAACLAVGTACQDACMQIQDVLCNCRGRTQDEINACETTQSAQEALAPPNNEQIKVCANLLQGCTNLIDGGTNCQALETISGRQACGIANE